jgi:hypothetical protein
MRTALRNKVNISSFASRDSFLRFYFIPFEDEMHPKLITHTAVGIANHLRTQAQLPNNARWQCEYCAPPRLPIFSMCPMRLSPHRLKNVWYTSGMSSGLLAIPPSLSSRKFSMNCPNLDVSIHPTRPMMDSPESIHQL